MLFFICALSVLVWKLRRFSHPWVLNTRGPHFGQRQGLVTRGLTETFYTPWSVLFYIKFQITYHTYGPSVRFGPT